MKLPNGDAAQVELEKLEYYCLSNTHPHGKHKARVFSSVLGVTRADAKELRALLRRAARENDAVPGITDEYGTRYVIDFYLGTWRQDCCRSKFLDCPSRANTSPLRDLLCAIGG
jgi:hypothetical protein